MCIYIYIYMYIYIYIYMCVCVHRLHQFLRSHLAIVFCTPSSTLKSGFQISVLKTNCSAQIETTDDNLPWSIRSNFHSRGVNTRKVVQLFGHNFLGCGSYDLGISPDFSPMPPLPSYTYQRLKFKEQTLVCWPESFREKTNHDYYCLA